MRGERAEFWVLLATHFLFWPLEGAVKFPSEQSGNTKFIYSHSFPNKRETTHDQVQDNDHVARVMLAMAQSGIAVYAPHTTLYCVRGGFKDWLLKGCFQEWVEKYGPSKTCEAVKASDESLTVEGEVINSKSVFVHHCGIEMSIVFVDYSLVTPYEDSKAGICNGFSEREKSKERKTEYRLASDVSSM